LGSTEVSVQREDKGISSALIFIKYQNEEVCYGKEIAACSTAVFTGPDLLVKLAASSG